MFQYDHKKIEKKWQEHWTTEKTYEASISPEKEKYYVLEMFPYPSGTLHMGHVRNYIIGDVVARYKRMTNFNVLHPIGWDSFGLPTENAAILHKMTPSQWNQKCIGEMKEQFHALGMSYDWRRELNTANPDYYIWVQWFLIKCWEQGLLYKDKKAVNWCTGCNTVLANEQVIDGQCARCESKVILKELEQWFLRITSYAERLLNDLDLLTEWPGHIIAMQRNWIGKQADGKYNLHDWCISRQRYWGAPIPFVTCCSCGTIPVTYQELPILLPTNVDITPGWPPPLARDHSFINVTCPGCNKPAKRVVDTLDTFVFSAWYYLRFTDPHNSKMPFATDKAQYWMPVDLYIGGVEHATVHLIYARFFHKVLYDLGLVKHPEPFKRLFAQGMICLNGSKMSKSKNNVVSPQEMIKEYGADVTRLYTLFLGPPDQDVEWEEKGIKGCSRFLLKVVQILNTVGQGYVPNWESQISTMELSTRDENFRCKIHQTIKGVTETIEQNFHFHTAISQLMKFLNDFQNYLKGSHNIFVVSEGIEKIILMLSPFIPHFAEEAWSYLGNSENIGEQLWPTWDDSLMAQEKKVMVFQVDGKTRGTIEVPAKEASIKSSMIERIPGFLSSRSIISKDDIVKIIFIPGKIINLVTKK